MTAKCRRRRGSDRPRLASGGGTVTRLRTVSSGSVDGNQVVQLPPVRVAMPPEEERLASGGGTVTRLRTVSSGSVDGNQVVQLPPVRVAMPPEEERLASGGGTVTRLRTVSSGSVDGNQVVQLPPGRSEWRLPNLAEIEPTLGHDDTGHVWYLPHTDPRPTAPRPVKLSSRLGQKL